MSFHTSLRRLGASAAVAGVAALVTGAGAAPADVSPAATAKIGPSGVGAVKIGKTYTALRRQKLVGKIRPGCELGGPNTRSAPLRAPLKGSVDFTLKNPRRVANITVTGGATARGVGIGDTLEDIQQAYPAAKVDHDTDEVFQYTAVRVPKSGGGRLEFAVSTETQKIILIGVPFIAACE